MTDHLPECWCRGCTHPHVCGRCRNCICDELRACEQRVFQEQIKGRQHDMVMAYLRGLDAAREAINKIPREDGGYCHVLHACDVEAAIDALRGQS